MMYLRKGIEIRKGIAIVDMRNGVDYIIENGGGIIEANWGYVGYGDALVRITGNRFLEIKNHDTLRNAGSTTVGSMIDKIATQRNLDVL